MIQNIPKPSARDRKKAMARADIAFSKFIRTRDSQRYEGRWFRCISCGRMLPIIEADCGHYISRRHMATRYSEDNCHAQCQHCNRYQDGYINEFREALFKKIGAEKLEELEIDRHMARKYSTAELYELAQEYEEKTKNLPFQIQYR